MKKIILSAFLVGLFIVGATFSSASAYRGYGPRGGYDGPCGDGGCAEYGYRGGHGERGMRGQGYGYGHGYGYCSQSVNWYQRENTTTKIVSQLTGKSEATIRADRQNGSWRYVLDKYNVDPAKFNAAMQKEAEQHVQSAVKSGSITKDQGDVILQNMKEPSSKK